MQMNVLMFMLAGSDTSRDAHKVLLGILPQLPTAILDEVRGRTLNVSQGALTPYCLAFCRPAVLL